MSSTLLLDIFLLAEAEQVLFSHIKVHRYTRIAIVTHKHTLTHTCIGTLAYSLSHTQIYILTEPNSHKLYRS